jgi:hypothetical protein
VLTRSPSSRQPRRRSGTSRTRYGPFALLLHHSSIGRHAARVRACAPGPQPRSAPDPGCATTFASSSAVRSTSSRCSGSSRRRSQAAVSRSYMKRKNHCGERTAATLRVRPYTGASPGSLAASGVNGNVNIAVKHEPLRPNDGSALPCRRRPRRSGRHIPLARSEPGLRRLHHQGFDTRV